nr:hypothetical protein [Bacteroidota bacterium]
MYRAVAFVVLLTSFGAKGAHFSGSAITYQCLGSSQYKIILELYLDCSGLAIIPQDLHFSNSCGVIFTLSGLTPVYTQVYSPVCDSQAQNTTCNGGSLPGFRYHRFEVQT